MNIPTGPRGLLIPCLLSAAVVLSVAHAAAPPQEIVIPGEKIFPESTTSGPDGSLYFGSIGQKMIFRAKPGAATAEPFVQSGADGLDSVFGVFADAKTNTLYACSGTPAFGPPQPGAPPPKPAALRTFDLKTGAPRGTYPFPSAPSLCNDIALGPDGSAYATDTLGNQVLRLKKGAKELDVWVAKAGFPPNAALDGISVLGQRVIVNALGASKLFSISIEKDGSAGTPAEITLDKTIMRPDGMRSFGKNSLLLIDGANGGELSKVTLTGNTGKLEVIKQGYPDGPVAVAVVGTTAYVLEGQLSGMMRRPGAEVPPPKPFHATAVEVGKP
jgi:sugar lactone lactonase YvrE